MTPQQPNKLDIIKQELVARQSDFTVVLPESINFERFVRIVQTACMQNPELLNINIQQSLLKAALQCATDGLLPDNREAAFVIFYVKGTPTVTYMPMVSGILKKIRNSGELLSLSTHVVYPSDQFDYCLGDNEHIEHKPFIGKKDKKEIPICAYCIVKTKDGGIYREVMSYDDIEKIRATSKQKDGTFWTQHWNEMAKKTVIRRLAKRLPMSTDVAEVIQRDDVFYNRKPERMQNPDVALINKQVIDLGDAPEIEEVKEDINHDNQDK